MKEVPLTALVGKKSATLDGRVELCGKTRTIRGVEEHADDVETEHRQTVADEHEEEELYGEAPRDLLGGEIDTDDDQRQGVPEIDACVEEVGAEECSSDS